MAENLSEIVYVDTGDLACSDGACLNRERTVSYATFVTLPDEVIVPDIRYKECCYEALVLADNTGKLHKNDFSGFWYNRQLSNETCTFLLVDKETEEEHEITDDTYGVYKPFGSYASQPTLTTFTVDWSKVLADLGEGSYQVKQDIQITGIEYSKLSNMYRLKTYSDLWADKTVRIDIVMDSFIEHQRVNFKGTNFKTSIRIGGFFGRREPKHEQDNIVYRNKKVEPISLKQVNEYQFQTELLPECMTSQIFDFYLFADEIYMNDYNINNHSYKYKNYKVKLEKNSNTKYYTENRRARINLVFQDRFVNRNKFNY